MKINVGVIFGGESVEHEVSIISAIQAMENLDKEKYNAIPIYITKKRDWYTGDSLKNTNLYKDIINVKRKCKQVKLEKINNDIILTTTGLIKRKLEKIDIVFPIMHGTNGEDGSIQGYLEILGAPYVGCNVYSAVVGQDKVFMKQIFKDEKIPITNYTWFFDKDYYTNKEEIMKKISKLKKPLIIKPARLGSSVGIGIGKDKESIEKAIEEAINYDNKIIVEEVVEDLMELNISIKGNYENQEFSVIEEVMGKDEILSYKDKYIADGDSKKGMVNTQRRIPANIDKKLSKQIEDLGVKAFKVLNASGTSRIDFLFDKKNKKLYINEINTIPGCLAFYLWEPKGVKYKELLTDMINVGIKNYKNREKRTFSFESNILESFDGTKGTKGKI